MNFANHHRDAAAKGDDQIAFENGFSCEEVRRPQAALEWYDEVKLNGGCWDIAASTSKVALLVALNRTEEAVSEGIAAILRAQKPDAGLIGEVARAWNADTGASQALKFCRHWLRHAEVRYSPSLWFSAAAYASQCHQFARSLQYLIVSLDLNDGNSVGDLFLDSDFAPLWHHLENEPLTLAEAAILRLPQWQTHRKALAQVRGHLSFESIGQVPLRLRSILGLDTASMTWQPLPVARVQQLATFESWCEAVRIQARENLAGGLRKAVAVHAATSGECA